MTRQKINKSDYTDSNGKVWGSVGENIRNGSKSFESLKSTFNNLDENVLQELPIIPIKGHWEYVTDTVVAPSYNHNFSNYFVDGNDIFANLACKIYLIILVNSNNSNPRQSICFPFIKNNETYIEFTTAATKPAENEYLIYIGDE